MKHIIILLDNSYSMNVYETKILEGLNKFLYNLKNNKNLYITIVLFTTNLKYICKGIDINDVSLINTEHLSSKGCTALYDSIYNTIDEWKNNSLDENIMYIISDGEDNNSVYSKDDIEQLVQTLDRWKIFHCDTDINNLNINNVESIEYKLDCIDDLFDKMCI